MNFKILANTFLLICLVLSSYTIFNLRQSKTNKVELISDNLSWENVPGVERKDNDLYISPVNLQISHNDGSLPQANPSVNIVDSPLIVNGDFLIEAEISDLEGAASIQLYGQLPVIFDEWRYERKSVRIEVTSSKIKIEIWDGTATNSIDQRTANILVNKTALISIAHKKGAIVVSVNNIVVASMPDHSVFSDKNVWFGLSSSSTEIGWKLNSLYAFGLNDSRVELKNNDSFRDLTITQKDSLREISTNNKRKIPIGVAVSSYPFFTDTNYGDIVKNQFSMITPENELKFQFVQPIRGTYTFQYTDSLVKYALENDMQVHGHMLIAHKSNPAWAEKSPETERKQILTDHVSRVVGHYKGKVSQWDVVNEPMSDDDLDYIGPNQGLRKQLWFEAMGEEYIDTAFRTARMADPSAKLFLNEYGIGKDGIRWDGLVKLLQRLQARGVPIDGVGFESHVYHAKDSVDPEVLKRHIQILANMGLVSRISENDVLGDDPELQAKQYSNILQVCLEEASCTSYGTWGVSDLYGSTTASDRYPMVLGDSLLWDENYAPKPALTWLQDTLKRY